MQAKKDFHTLLREHPDIDRHSRWSDVKKKIDSDPRYKAVDSSGMREDWFREYCKILKDEKRRAKEKEREHKRENRDKEKHRSKRDKGDRDGERAREKKEDDRHEKESEGEIIFKTDGEVSSFLSQENFTNVLRIECFYIKYLNSTKCVTNRDCTWKYFNLI